MYIVAVNWLSGRARICGVIADFGRDFSRRLWVTCRRGITEGVFTLYAHPIFKIFFIQQYV